MKARQSFLLAGMIAIAAAFLPPVMFGDLRAQTERQGSDPWVLRIYEFQTLIAGIAAIGAAWWTVAAMDRTEAAAARRHAQQIDVALRSDRLRMQRALHPQFHELEELRKTFNAFSIYFEDEEDSSTALGNWIVQIASHTRALDELLKRPHFAEGAKLFDGDLNHRIWHLQQRIDFVMPIMQSVSSFWNDGTPRMGKALNRFNEWMPDHQTEMRVIHFCAYFLSCSQDILDGMSRMAKLYGIGGDPRLGADGAFVSNPKATT